MPGVAGKTPKVFFDALPRKVARYLLTGVTKDSAGTPISGVTLTAFEAATERVVNMVTSNGSGVYSIEVHSIPGTLFQIDAYKDGVTPLAGTTLNTLTATPT